MLSLPLIAMLVLGAGSEIPQEAGNTEHPPEARDWRQTAVNLAATNAADIKDPYRRAEVLAHVAQAQIPIAAENADKTLHDALSAAEEVVDPTFQGWALHEIVLAQIAADDLLGARQTAARINSERPRSAAFAVIAQMQLRAGNVAAAQATAREVKEVATAGDLQRQIVLKQVADGELAAARATALHIADDFSAALALGDVAAAKVRAGDTADANALATHARKRYRSQVYGRIALARVDVGDLHGAVATLANIDDAYYRALTQARVGARRAAAGDRSQAQKLFADAAMILESAKGRDDIRSLTWAQLARIQFGAGERGAAQESLNRAMALVGATVGPQRDEALDAIARDQANMGDADAALSTAAQVSDRVIQALLIRDVIASQPDSAAAHALVRRSVAIADPLTRTAALFGLIGVQLLRAASNHQSRDVTSTIDAAREAVLATKDVTLQPPALSALAAARLSLGSPDAARPLFDEALVAASALAPPERRANAYLQIVRALDERLYFLGKPLTGGQDVSPGPAAVR